MNYFKNKKKIAVVFSGGCIKAAAFHIGVCSGLQERGFRFAGGSHNDVSSKFPRDDMTIKTYIGSSAGAIIATFLASGFDTKTIIKAFIQGKKGKSGIFSQSKTPTNSPSNLKPLSYRDIFTLSLKMGHPLRLFSDLFRRRTWMRGGGIEYFLKKSFKVNGLFTTHNLGKYFQKNVCKENSFQALGVNLYIVASLLNQSRKAVFGAFSNYEVHPHAEYNSYASISEAIAASSSLPPFFSPYGISNEKGEKTYFFDGDIRDTLPTHIAEETGCDLIFASYSIQPYHYNKKLGSLHEHGMPLILNQALYQLLEQKIFQKKREKEKLTSLYEAIKNYMKKENFEKSSQEKILDFFESKTHFKNDVETFYIHPDPKDSDMFFTDHFSLNEKVLERIVRKGFKAAILALRNLDTNETKKEKTLKKKE